MYFCTEQHDGRRGRHHFRQRGSVKEGVFGHQFFYGFDRALAHRPMLEHAVVLDPPDSPGQAMVGDALFDQGLDSPEARFGEGKR
jgi:hypothetical protein